MGHNVEVVVAVVGGWITIDDIFAFAITSGSIIGIDVVVVEGDDAAGIAGSRILCLWDIVVGVADGRHGGDGEVLGVGGSALNYLIL